MPEEITEYAGLTREAVVAIERHRLSPEESKSDILVRALRTSELPAEKSGGFLDFGQGAKLPWGERLFLFLTEEKKSKRQPDTIATVTERGLVIDQKLFEVSHGSYLNAPMKWVQERAGHLNKDGKLVSLNAWTKWHVQRGRELVPLVDLKDPALARTRGRALDIELDLSFLDQV